jgi:hypothetical protein
MKEEPWNHGGRTIEPKIRTLEPRRKNPGTMECHLNLNALLAWSRNLDNFFDTPIENETKLSVSLF